MAKKKPDGTPYHIPYEYDQDLITIWSAKSKTCNLPLLST